MCGRFKRTSDKKKVFQAFEVTAGVNLLSIFPADKMQIELVGANSITNAQAGLFESQ